MRTAIIGAGYGGLAAGLKLARAGQKVTIFEADDKPGGLAVGFREKKWKWSIEKHYHHFFTNDESVLNLATEINHPVLTVRPKTSTFINGEIDQLDSPLSLLKFEKLPFNERMRLGAVLAYLKLTPNWKALEKVTAKKFLIKYMGDNSWKLLWEPLFRGKFHDYYDKIPASWFWARIKKRTASLSYPKGGFLNFAENLVEEFKKMNGLIFFRSPVKNVIKQKELITLSTDKNTYDFDRVICTLPTYLFTRMVKGLPKDYSDDLLKLEGLGAVNMLLSLNKKFLVDGTYWLNINAKHFPFLAIVEHTNFMDKKNYNNEHLVYVGNYLPAKHEYFRKEPFDLLREFYPFLKTINPTFDESWVNNVYLFKAPFAQPIAPLNYSDNIPAFKTPIDGLYLSNMQQVYPWDRGTNYAVENGEKVAEMILRGN